MLVSTAEVISANQTAVEGTGSVEVPSGNAEFIVTSVVVPRMGGDKAVLVSTCVVAGGKEVISVDKVIGAELVIPTVEDIGVVDVLSVSTKNTTHMRTVFVQWICLCVSCRPSSWEIK